MQSSLIALFVFSLIMAAICFHIGYRAPERPGTHLSKAGFLIWLFLLAPFLTWVLIEQSGSIERLEATGFSAHPSIVEAVGMANGTGDEPTWLFKADATPESILSFYRSPDTRPGWSLMAETPQLLAFGRGEMRMHVFASKGWGGKVSVMYKLSRE